MATTRMVTAIVGSMKRAGGETISSAPRASVMLWARVNDVMTNSKIAKTDHHKHEGDDERDVIEARQDMPHALPDQAREAAGTRVGGRGPIEPDLLGRRAKDVFDGFVAGPAQVEGRQKCVPADIFLERAIHHVQSVPPRGTGNSSYDTHSLPVDRVGARRLEGARFELRCDLD